MQQQHPKIDYMSPVSFKSLQIDFVQIVKLMGINGSLVEF